MALSGIQHFAFCRRQWALIHIEGAWSENSRTIEGKLLHDSAHDAYRSESRGEVFLSRAMPIRSSELGFSGECDIVEFRKVTKDGITLKNHPGIWQAYPVEYKRGSPKEDECDLLQLTAQAMCLEEMLCCTIREGALYYFETRRRLKAEITEERRETVRRYAAEMHDHMERGYLPKSRRTRACNACSLKEICLPQLFKLQSASEYNDDVFSREERE